MKQRQTQLKLIGTVLIALFALSGCFHMPAGPQINLPPGVDGYQCYHRKSTSNGIVYAEGYPDYRSGYDSFTMTWELRKSDSLSPGIQVKWTQGPHAISPPSWLVASQAVRGLPPLDTKISLKLSSGEAVEKIFIPPKNWREWKSSQSGNFGGYVDSHNPEFIDAFTKAAWAELQVTDPSGVRLAYSRIDLSQIADELVVMRKLGAEIEKDVTDYANKCGPIHIEVDYW